LPKELSLIDLYPSIVVEETVELEYINEKFNRNFNTPIFRPKRILTFVKFN